MRPYNLDNRSVIFIGKTEITLEYAVALSIVKRIETKPSQIKDNCIIGIGTVETLVLEI